MMLTVPRVVAVVLIVALGRALVQSDEGNREAERTAVARQIGKLSQHINI